MRRRYCCRVSWAHRDSPEVRNTIVGESSTCFDNAKRACSMEISKIFKVPPKWSAAWKIEQVQDLVKSECTEWKMELILKC